MSSRAATRGGIALPAALLTVLATTLVSATLATLSRTELQLARDRRTAAEGLAAADSCVATVTATLAPGWDFTPSLAGADGTAGTADDGLVVAPPGCRARLLSGATGAVRPYLDATATVPGGGRAVRAILSRAARPPTPGVLWIADPGTSGAVSGTLALDGVDPRRSDAEALPGVVGDTDATVLDTWLAATATIRLGAGTLAAQHAPPPPFVELATRLRALGAATSVTIAPSSPAPTLQTVAGDLVVDAPGFGAGLLFVEGRLDIRADFSFSGLVVAAGGVRLASGVSFSVDGALWVGGAPAVDVLGTAAVRYDLSALDAVDALATLPRRAVIVGLEDR